MTVPAQPAPHTRTKRLDLYRPTPDDIDGVFEICRDPQSWAHFPSLRHTERRQSEAFVAGWIQGWEAGGLGTWIVRARGEAAIIGFGGCSVRHDAYWNIGYRLETPAQGLGYATELAREAIEQAHVVRPELPAVAYLLEHNAASAAVARRLGLTLAHRGPDAGNPDPSAIRLVFADRVLSEEQLAATMK